MRFAAAALFPVANGGEIANGGTGGSEFLLRHARATRREQERTSVANSSSFRTSGGKQRPRFVIGIVPRISLPTGSVAVLYGLCSEVARLQLPIRWKTCFPKTIRWFLTLSVTYPLSLV